MWSSVLRVLSEPSSDIQAMKEQCERERAVRQDRQSRALENRRQLRGSNYTQDCLEPHVPHNFLGSGREEQRWRWSGAELPLDPVLAESTVFRDYVEMQLRNVSPESMFRFMTTFRVDGINTQLRKERQGWVFRAVMGRRGPAGVVRPLQGVHQGRQRLPEPGLVNSQLRLFVGQEPSWTKQDVVDEPSAERLPCRIALVTNPDENGRDPWRYLAAFTVPNASEVAHCGPQGYLFIDTMAECCWVAEDRLPSRSQAVACSPDTLDTHRGPLPYCQRISLLLVTLHYDDGEPPLVMEFRDVPLVSRAVLRQAGIPDADASLDMVFSRAVNLEPAYAPPVPEPILDAALSALGRRSVVALGDPEHIGATHLMYVFNATLWPIPEGAWALSGPGLMLAELAMALNLRGANWHRMVGFDSPRGIFELLVHTSQLNRLPAHRLRLGAPATAANTPMPLRLPIFHAMHPAPMEPPSYLQHPTFVTSDPLVAAAVAVGSNVEARVNIVEAAEHTTPELFRVSAPHRTLLRFAETGGLIAPELCQLIPRHRSPLYAASTPAAPADSAPYLLAQNWQPNCQLPMVTLTGHRPRNPCQLPPRPAHFPGTSTPHSQFAAPFSRVRQSQDELVQSLLGLSAPQQLVALQLLYSHGHTDPVFQLLATAAAHQLHLPRVDVDSPLESAALSSPAPYVNHPDLLRKAEARLAQDGQQSAAEPRLPAFLASHHDYLWLAMQATRTTNLIEFYQAVNQAAAQLPSYDGEVRPCMLMVICLLAELAGCHPAVQLWRLEERRFLLPSACDMPAADACAMEVVRLLLHLPPPLQGARLNWLRKAALNGRMARQQNEAVRRLAKHPHPTHSQATRAQGMFRKAQICALSRLSEATDQTPRSRGADLVVLVEMLHHYPHPIQRSVVLLLESARHLFADAAFDAQLYPALRRIQDGHPHASTRDLDLALTDARAYVLHTDATLNRSRRAGSVMRMLRANLRLHTDRQYLNAEAVMVSRSVDYGPMGLGYGIWLLNPAAAAAASEDDRSEAGSSRRGRRSAFSLRF